MRRNWHFHADEVVEPRKVLQHKATLQVAGELGYGFDDLNDDLLRARYTGKPSPLGPTDLRRLFATARRRVRATRT